MRTGVSSFAALCGLACYALLAQLHMNLLVAGVLGLAFALLVRAAAGSLVREWLASQTSRAGGGKGGQSTSPAPGDTAAHPPRRPGRPPRQ